jgi:antitoxin component YwqK of YwqJK toxin-antitoxin module
MKKYALTLLVSAFSLAAFAQSTTLEERRELRKNLTIKEWNTEGKRKWLDHLTVYDENGNKIEEAEYAAYGLKERTTIEYDENGKVKQEIVYDYHNKPFRIRKYEYNEEGKKTKQYNYLPSGKLFSTKVFEYIKK